jgi:hypothetical protein
MNRSVGVLGTRLRERKKRPTYAFDRNEYVHDDLEMSAVLALVQQSVAGQARYEYDDGKDHIPYLIWGARTTSGCIEYHLQYHDHDGKYWTH